MSSSPLKRIKAGDFVARWVIQIGGLFAIVCMITIVVIITATALPLLQEPSAELRGQYDLPFLDDAASALAVCLGDYREVGYVVEETGRVSFFGLSAEGSLAEGTLRDQISLTQRGGPEDKIVYLDRISTHQYGLLWKSGAISLLTVRMLPQFDAQGNRTIAHAVDEQMVFSLETPADHVKQICLRAGSDGESQTVTVLYDDHLDILRKVMTTNLFGDQTSETFTHRSDMDLFGRAEAMFLNTAGNRLFIGTRDGLLWWAELTEEGAISSEKSNSHIVDPQRTDVAVTALGMLLGDVSLAVGDNQGNLSTWFAVRNGEQSQYRRIRELRPQTDAIVDMQPSRRNKSLVTLSASGVIHFDHNTSRRALLTLQADAPLRVMGYSARGDGLLALDDRGRAHLWEIHIEHPETSWKTLFGKVWYESHGKPEFVWQSSSGTDDFEPKFSLMPLMFGTLKGTFYAMLFATPLALLGAVYTNQFAHPRLRGVIKPAMEIMAGVPSVVIGFLIALWLAPVLARWIVPFFVSLVLIPLIGLLFLFGWQLVHERRWALRLGGGVEFILLVPVIILGWWLSVQAGLSIERVAFDGDFSLWLFKTFDMRLDQRNSIIIAFGLGFAVIPIIFTISEDALSSVPNSLTAASLALGASRWQTTRRIVLLSASPGIFAAIIIGFARAVGETMIVLMATGNTPIMDWSPFTGMRTLSANIAVEIPEAPKDGTLYRILFLSAVILFLMTFVLNTGAELVREHLRKKYGRFQ